MEYEIILSVNGMKNKDDENELIEAVSSLSGIEQIVANYKTGNVEIRGFELDREYVISTIEDQGFTVY